MDIDYRLLNDITFLLNICVIVPIWQTGIQFVMHTKTHGCYCSD